MTRKKQNPNKTEATTEIAETENHSMNTSQEAEKETIDSDMGAHLDDIRMPDDIDNAPQDEDGPIQVDQEGVRLDLEPERISKDAFWSVFKTAFQMPGLIMPEFKPLEIQKEEQETGRAASDAIYNLLEIYYPNALTPNSEVMANLLAAGPFLIGKILIVKQIFAARNARNVTDIRDHAPQKPNSNMPQRDVAPQSPTTANWVLPGQGAAT